MIKNNLSFINQINKKNINKKNLTRFAKNYKKIFNSVVSEINDNHKTLNILNKKFKFNFKTKDLKNFKKFETIAFIGMGGSILGAEAISEFLKKKNKKKFIFF